MRQLARFTLLCLCLTISTGAQKPPLLPEETVATLAGELSGETAKRNLEYISRLHRTRGSKQFRMAAEHIAAQLRSYGITDVKIEEFPADGKIWYGTQRSRPAWDAEFAELWELRLEQSTAPCGAKEEKWVRDKRLASWDAAPITLAQDSESGEATAELVDVGSGAREADYAGKDVRAKLVLISGQPGAAAELAVGKFGAAGIVSYAQNQAQAWHGDDEDLVRWGHLETFSPVKTFAFMISPRQAALYRRRLSAGEKVVLEAKVKAGQRVSSYDIVSATIPGADEKLRNDEIVFTCHLDHPRPGANDNASGCVTILEVARTLQKLITEKRIPRPARTIRFLWPPEIEGSIVYLNARPEIAARFKTNIHMDMVGGGPETKAVFHVTRGPASVPSFVNDVAEAFAQFVNDQTYQFAATGAAVYPLIAPEGGKEPLQAQLTPFTQGSDHQVFAEGSWRIPTIYFNDWPDRYIHTNKDTPDKIDPTKLKRAGFIGAASAYYLANLEKSGYLELAYTLVPRRMHSRADLLRQLKKPDSEEAAFRMWSSANWERGYLKSFSSFLTRDVQSDMQGIIWGSMTSLPPPPADQSIPKPQSIVFERTPSPKGPMSGFGYDYFEDKYGADKARTIRLRSFQGEGAGGGIYVYEALNFVDGKRNMGEIAALLSGAYGPVPFEIVLEYLRALESIGVIREKK